MEARYCSKTSAVVVVAAVAVVVVEEEEADSGRRGAATGTPTPDVPRATQALLEEVDRCGCVRMENWCGTV